MPDRTSSSRRHFTGAARIAAAAARAAKRAEPDHFGMPELFIVKAGDHAFTWELRRFGGVVLQRGTEAFSSAALARAAGEAALTALCTSPDLPRFEKNDRGKNASAATAEDRIGR